jgi:hypothetical protein
MLLVIKVAVEYDKRDQRSATIEKREMFFSQNICVQCLNKSICLVLLLLGLASMQWKMDPPLLLELIMISICKCRSHTESSKHQH